MKVNPSTQCVSNAREAVGPVRLRRRATRTCGARTQNLPSLFHLGQEMPRARGLQEGPVVMV